MCARGCVLVKYATCIEAKEHVLCIEIKKIKVFFNCLTLLFGKWTYSIFTITASFGEFVFLLEGQWHGDCLSNVCSMIKSQRDLDNICLANFIIN